MTSGDNLVVSAPQEVFLSTAATRQWDWRLAGTVVLASIIGLAVAAPYANYRWPVTPSFIAAYEAALLVNDLITAILLIGQFRQVRSLGLLIVGCGYLFTTVIVAMHALSFPDVFSATGLLGANRQTTPWLYIMWHSIFPIFICVYALVVRSRWNAPLEEHRAATAIVIGVASAVAVAAVCAFLATAGVDSLPEIIRGNDYKRVVTSGIAPGTWLISLVALALLWVRTRGRTVLDLWLMVVMVAWLLDILLSTLISTVRYDFGWYAGRSYGLMAASFVLGAFLLEANLLYGRLARSLIDAKGKNAALETRTAELARSHDSAIRDVTARKKADEALRGSEERLRMTVEAAEMGTWSWDIQRDEVSPSEKFCTLLGLTSDTKLTRQDFRSAVHPDDWQQLDQSLKKTLELGMPYDTEFRAVWPDSTIHWIAAKGSAHRNAEGVPVTIQGIVMDITDRRAAEEALKHREAQERRSEELKRSNDDLQQFAYIAAHDLQEPLRMVASYTQLLAKRYKGRLDSDADEFIAYAVDGAHRMQLLIGDLLAYCRVGTAGKELRETSSEAALEDALLNLQGAIQESGGVVTHDPLPTVVADGAQLAQLFQNVVGNAIKYRSAELPRVHVSAKKNGGHEWIFSMEDNGVGIDTKYFEKIFVMFQRLHSRDEFSGTGIGLTLCKKIAERHGGRMWVESEFGKGSTFYFSLPERG
jgi:PAS domain S-box-containing protein